MAGAWGVQVEDAAAAYERCVANGGVGVLPPTTLGDDKTKTMVGGGGVALLPTCG